MEKGLIRWDGPEMLAVAYTTPISAFIHLCDREPEKTEDAIRKIEAQPAFYCDLWGEVTLFDLDKYLGDLILNYQSTLSERHFSGKGENRDS